MRNRTFKHPVKATLFVYSCGFFFNSLCPWLFSIYNLLWLQSWKDLVHRFKMKPVRAVFPEGLFFAVVLSNFWFFLQLPLSILKVSKKKCQTYRLLFFSSDSLAEG